MTVIDVLVLAGGQSRRMGADKATLLIEGQPLVVRVIDAVSHLGGVKIVGGDAEIGRIGNVTHVLDPEPHIGPFGALVHATQSVTGDEVLVVSCDLAQLTAGHVDMLVDARRRTNADVSVPLVGGRRQWHGVCFASRIVPELTSRFEGGVRSLHSGFAGFRECAVLSTSPGFFRDIDTPEDLEQLQRHAVPAPDEDIR